MSRRYASADQLLGELGIVEPAEINLEAIAEYCGATILYQPLSGCDARILGASDRAIITVNSRGTESRQRFSAGHELGHWMRDRGKSVFACSEGVIDSAWDGMSQEAIANRFAADLLMPTKMFAKYARGRKITFATVRELMDVFKTSFTATAIRIVQAGPLPAMLICSTPEKRKWFVRGPAVPESVWPREIPTAYTVAADLIKGKKATTPNEIRADGWITRPGSSGYCLIEDSMRIGEDILTLLWWNDERPLVQITDQDERRSYYDRQR